MFDFQSYVEQLRSLAVTLPWWYYVVAYFGVGLLYSNYSILRGADQSAWDKQRKFDLQRWEHNSVLRLTEVAPRWFKWRYTTLYFWPLVFSYYSIKNIFFGMYLINRTAQSPADLTRWVLNREGVKCSSCKAKVGKKDLFCNKCGFQQERNTVM